MSTGDTVLFKLVNQRVDKKDLVDMQALPLEAQVRALGALLGVTSGCLTDVPYTFNSITNIVTLGECSLFWSRSGILGTDLVDSPLRGGVVLHDPDRPAQNGNSTVDLTGLTEGRLFFQRRVADADYDNRAHYPSPGSGEQIATTATRAREWVAFAATDTNDSVLYNPGQDWYHFANFDVVAGALRLYPLSVFGDVLSQVSGSLHGLQGATWMSAPVVGDLASRPADWGLTALIQNVILVLLQILDGDVTYNPGTRRLTSNPNTTTWWTGNGGRGLSQINDELDTAQTDIAALQVGDVSLRDDFLSYFRSYLAAQPQVLATYNAFNLGLGGEGEHKKEPFITYSVTTEGSVGSRTWKFTFVPQILFHYGGTISTFNHQILALRAFPIHHAVWGDAGVGRAADVQVFTDSGCTVLATLPFTTSGTFYAKVRFRNLDDASIAEPDHGFYVELVGLPIFS